MKNKPEESIGDIDELYHGCFLLCECGGYFRVDEDTCFSLKIDGWHVGCGMCHMLSKITEMRFY